MRPSSTFPGALTLGMGPGNRLSLSSACLGACTCFLAEPDTLEAALSASVSLSGGRERKGALSVMQLTTRHRMGMGGLGKSQTWASALWTQAWALGSVWPPNCHT